MHIIHLVFVSRLFTHANLVLIQAEFPASILQGVFFDKQRPHYMNYGAIGYIIGHEITHGFDDEGRQYDKDGNLVDWWQAKTKSAFDEKAQCIIDQYSNITVPGINLNVSRQARGWSLFNFLFAVERHKHSRREYC